MASKKAVQPHDDPATIPAGGPGTLTGMSGAASPTAWNYTEPTIPPTYQGVQALTLCRVVGGSLPEERAGCAASHHNIRFVRSDEDPTKFEVTIAVGNSLALRMDMGAFVDAFLAVVPRWFWRPKDERSR